MRVGARPADDRALRLAGDELLELGARLLRRDDDHLRRAHPAHATVELLGHLFQVLRDELLDVALESGLRPAALVVAAGNVVGAVHDLFQPSRVEPEQLPALAAHEGDDRALAAADERNERREVELPADPDAVGHRLDQRARPPDVVHSGREDRDAVRPVALELVGEVVPDPAEVLLERDPLVMREPPVVRLGMALAVREQRADPGRGVAGGRSRLRVEVEVEADRAPLLRPELRELAEPVPAHRLGHVDSFPVRAAILRV